MVSSISIIVVEDEFTLANDISLRLTKMGYNVIGTAPSVAKALIILEKNVIDLAIIDIQLKGTEDGIDLATIINEKYKIPFIFLTSFAMSTVVERAKTVHPAGYMLKPFNDRQFHIAIEMALTNFSNNSSASLRQDEKLLSIDDDNSVLPIHDSLFLKKDNHFDRVAYSDILWLEAESNYTIVHTHNGKYIYSVVLKKMEEKLPKSLFMRVHRSYVINLSVVSGFTGNMLHIRDQKIPVSKQYRKMVFGHFEVI